jgi:Putative  PD-(D/E)XK family member, (DUF4420)
LSAIASTRLNNGSNLHDLRAELDAKWREAKLANRSGHEWRGVALAVNAPIRFVAGVREPDERMALLLEVPLISAPSSTFRLQADGLSVTDQRRPEEGIYRLAIALERDELRDVFEVVAADIINVVILSATASAAIIAAKLRLEAWQACLKSRRRGFSKEEQVGLLGELMVVQLIAAEIGYSDVVEAWQGPLHGIHDFTLLGVAIEVKATLGVGSLLRISRLDQLESAGLSALVIARVRLREDGNGKSLCGAVLEIRNAIARSAPSALSVFNEKLMRAGYLDLDSRLYDGLSVVMQEIYGFEVVENGFPRLTMSTVPPGIVDASYVIDERSIAGFRLDAVTLRAVMRSMNGARQ